MPTSWTSAAMRIVSTCDGGSSRAMAKRCDITETCRQCSARSGYFWKSGSRIFSASVCRSLRPLTAAMALSTDCSICLRKMCRARCACSSGVRSKATVSTSPSTDRAFSGALRIELMLPAVTGTTFTPNG